MPTGGSSATRVAAVAAVLVLGAFFVGAAAEAIEGWGEFVDPDGDCRARAADDGRLVIDVPGKLHDLWPDPQGSTNAPRVLRDAPAPDVVARVTVAGEVDAKDGTGVAPGKRPFRAASLLLWEDEKNFVRLDRGCVVREGKPIYFAYYHVFRNGKRTTHLSKDIENRPASLRLHRRGNKVKAAVSQDEGKTWDEFPEQEVKLAEEMKVGVAALNATTEPFEATFEKFEVTAAE
jgi:hypothetical protein